MDIKFLRDDNYVEECKRRDFTTDLYQFHPQTGKEKRPTLKFTKRKNVLRKQMADTAT
jgi:hypothetical protein